MTRPEPDGTEFARALSDMGHQPVVEPLMSAVPVSFDPQRIAADLAAADAVIVTSRNAVRALEAASLGDRFAGAFIVAVGPGTADAASKLGARDVLSIDGRAMDIVAQLPGVLTARGQADACRVLYLRGADITVDLVGALRSVLPDWSVSEAIVYRTALTAAPSERLRAQLAAGMIDAVALFSTRTAAAYVDALSRERLIDAMRRKAHYCLSDRVAERLSIMKLQNIAVSAKPNVQEMLELIGGPAAQSMH